MCDNLLSMKDYEKIFKKILNNEESKYISSEFKPISENVEGFLGEHYKLNITYSSKGEIYTEQLFVKTKPVKNQSQRQAAEETGIFKKEIFFYDFLLQEFEKYGFDTSFVGKYYHSVPNETLVLEDITRNGYVLPKRQKLFDLNDIKILLKSVALLHAAGFAYEQRKSTELQRTFKINKEYSQFVEEIFLVMYINPKGHANDWWVSSFKNIEKLIDYLPNDNNFKTEFKSLLQNAEIGKIFVQETNYVKTLGHGDTWSNNMMLKYENNIPVGCKLFDYQVLRYFYPSYDVLLSIYFNTDAEFRKKYEQELILYYYQTLTDILNKYDCNIDDIMSYEDYNKSLDVVRADVLAQIACVKLVIYLPTEQLTEFVKDDGTSDENNKKYNDMSVNAFLNNDVYRSVITECLYDFYNALKMRIQ